MTTGAINGGRFLDPHFRVTPHALSVVGRHQAWLRQMVLIKGFAMATTASGWLRQCRAVVVTSSTDGILILVERAGQAAVFDLAQNRIYDFPMG